VTKWEVFRSFTKVVSLDSTTLGTLTSPGRSWSK